MDSFSSLDEIQEGLQRFRKHDSDRWILGRHGYATPADVRRRLLAA